MAKHIHIHLPARIAGKGRDAGEFEESKHPRAQNGQFGSGGGGAKPAAKGAAPKGASGGTSKLDMNNPQHRQLASALLKQANAGPKKKAAPKPPDLPGPKSSSSGSWSHTKNEAASQAAEKAMEDAWDDESGKGHQKAIVAIKEAIKVTEQGIREGSPKYAPDRKQEVERLKKRLADHEKHAKS